MTSQKHAYGSRVVAPHVWRMICGRFCASSWIRSGILVARGFLDHLRSPTSGSRWSRSTRAASWDTRWFASVDRGSNFTVAWCGPTVPALRLWLQDAGLLVRLAAAPEPKRDRRQSPETEPGRAALLPATRLPGLQDPFRLSVRRRGRVPDEVLHARFGNLAMPISSRRRTNWFRLGREPTAIRFSSRMVIP